MGIGPEAINGGAMVKGRPKSRVGRTVLNGDDDYDENSTGYSRCWFKLRFFASCLSAKSKADSSGSGTSSQYAGSKSTNGTSKNDSINDSSKDNSANGTSKDNSTNGTSKENSTNGTSKDNSTNGTSKDNSIGDTSKDQPVTSVKSSSTISNSGSIPLTPKIEELKIASQLRKFSYYELKHATRNFRCDSLLGEGGFGRVYKGWVDENSSTPVKPGTGLTVAVKTLNQAGVQGHKEWLAEINYLGELIHPHLVKLIGYCIEDVQRLLVYEFMARGSLENHLFKRSVPLPWAIRMKVALNAAKGLAFLHEEAERPVIYRDFKTSNILLDLDYNAKLSDFGLAKDGPEGDKTHVSTRVMGTYGYAAPEYVMTGHLTARSDVYSFGVVLLEMLTGRRSMDKTRPNGEQNLVEWARPLLVERRRFYKLIDPRLEGRFSIKGAQQAVVLAARCLNRDSKARPLMSQVVEALEPLPNLHDLASSSSSFQATQTARASSSLNARNGSRLQQPGLSKNPQLLQSPYRNRSFQLSRPNN